MTVLTLVPDSLPTDDTTKLLRQLLKESIRGRLRGIAFVGYVDEGTYIANACGEAYEDPALTLFMLRDLDAKLELKLKGLTI